MDGYFEYEGKKIGYTIVDDKNSSRYVNGVYKLSRYLNFFDEDKHLGVISVYDTEEKLFNLTPYIVKDYYEKDFLKK